MIKIKGNDNQWTEDIYSELCYDLKLIIFNF